MFGILFLALAVHPGQGPGDWVALNGEPNVSYRWSRPDSNTCLVEFSNGNTSGPLSFDTTVKIITNRPQTPAKPTGLTPLKQQPTRITPQTGERRMSVQLFQMGRDAQRLHDCYGVMQVSATARTSVDTDKAPSTSTDHQ
jgi:hypothetical protein